MNTNERSAPSPLVRSVRPPAARHIIAGGSIINGHRRNYPPMSDQPPMSRRAIANGLLIVAFFAAIITPLVCGGSL